MNNSNSIFKNDTKEQINELINHCYGLTNKLKGNLSTQYNAVDSLVQSMDKRLNSYSNYFNKRYSYVEMDYKSCKVGIDGEERINRTLYMHSNIINLQNIRLEVKDDNGQIHSIENDNILLTKNGIFVLEVKNFGQIGNYDLIIEKDGRWLRKNRHNGETSLLKNVTSQNNRHIGYLNKFINESMNKSFDDYIDIDGIIVIANEKVNIENHNQNQNIFRDSELYSYIKNKQPQLKKEELDEIKALIEKNNLPAKKYIVYDYYTELYKNIESLQKLVKKYNKIVDAISEQGRLCDEKSQEYKRQLNLNNFYCSECLSIVSKNENSCRKCGCEETIDESEKQLEECKINELKELEKKKQEEEHRKNERKKVKKKTSKILCTALIIAGAFMYKKYDDSKIVSESNFYDGLAVVATKNNLYGYKNESGEIVIKPQYQYASDFSEGLAPVTIDDDHFAFINKDGEIVVGPIEGLLGNFYDGVAYFIKYDGEEKNIETEKFGIIKSNGEILVDAIYDSVSEFSEGLAVVEIDGLYGYINIKAEIVIEPQFSSAGEFEDGVATVGIKTVDESSNIGTLKSCRINESGKIIKVVKEVQYQENN